MWRATSIQRFSSLDHHSLRAITVVGGRGFPWTYGLAPLRPQQQQQRTMNAAAATTSRHGKRDLTPDQIEGVPLAAATRATTTTNTSAERKDATIPPLDVDEGGLWHRRNAIPLGLVASLLVTCGLYFYNETPNFRPQATAMKAVPVTLPANLNVNTNVPTTKTTTTTKETSPNEKNQDEGVVAAAAADIHKVSVIPFPPGMRNTEASTTGNITAIPSSHPVDGNRVLMYPTGTANTATTSPPIHDASLTQQARERLLQQSGSGNGTGTFQNNTNVTNTETVETLLQSHQSAWSYTEATYFADLEHLSRSQLQARIVQLAAEMKDRTKWEAVRLKEFLAMKEKETAERYMELLQKQRLEFEDLLAQRLREQEMELSKQYRAVMQEKDESVQAVINAALQVQKDEHEEDKKVFEETTTANIQAALEAQFKQQLAEFMEQVAKEMQRKVMTLTELSKKLEVLENALESSKASKLGSVRAHKLSAAALALAEKLETSQAAGPEIAALMAAAGKEGVIATALSTIPSAATLGVPTLPQLQARFDVVYKKARQAAHVPNGQMGLEGQLVGMLLATTTFEPDPNEPAPEGEKDSPDYVLCRAKHYVHIGELEKAVGELEKMDGQVLFTVSDWKKSALDRVAVEKALKVIKMECALINESLVD